MTKNLVIVESPAKAKTIEKFLGKDFTVRSCYGHVRDLSKTGISVDVENDFEPQYTINDDKQKVVKELKSIADKSEVIWLASDEDREGEAIAWHLQESLKLDKERTKRIVFNEITKSAILRAVENPRTINLDLVNAQQARRILDRIVGYEISPILWRKIKPSLSAGRVQSVAVRLIVERENEIKAFVESFDYKILADFEIDGERKTLHTELDRRLPSKDQALDFLQACTSSAFTVCGVEKKPSKKSPSPPFTTSTLQQEASRKLGFSVSRTMQVAQQLYEAGHITYMRTDSVNLSNAALAAAQKVITETYGEKYVKVRKFTNKIKGAQEAHEAIRPTFIENEEAGGMDASQKRLYSLIRKRTLASQMADAKIEKTIVEVEISDREEKFQATGEIVLFDGFLRMYFESTDEEQDEDTEKILPPLKQGMKLTLEGGQALQHFSQHPPRYTEASLVKKMEELGIGRPSTYAPTISTIQKRTYVVKEDREGKQRILHNLVLQDNQVLETKKEQTYGIEKSKLFPTDIGMIVNLFLEENFKDIVDYNFTAKVEKEFDAIAQGEKQWNEVLHSFYEPFHKEVEYTKEHSEKVKGERLLGVDPKSGKHIYARIGRFGPMVQIGEVSDEEKPSFAGLKADQRIDTISLEEALSLFDLPRNVGVFEDKEIVVSTGRFGPYVKHNGKFISLAKTDDPYTIVEERCIELIQAKRIKDIEKEKLSALLPKVIGSLDNGDVVLNIGRFGLYLTYDSKNYRIPKGEDAMALTLEAAKGIVEGKSSSKKSLRTFEENPDIQVMEGRYGPYISYKKKNYKLPKGVTVDSLTLEACLEIIAATKKK